MARWLSGAAEAAFFDGAWRWLATLATQGCGRALRNRGEPFADRLQTIAVAVLQAIRRNRAESLRHVVQRAANEALAMRLRYLKRHKRPQPGQRLRMRIALRILEAKINQSSRWALPLSLEPDL